MATAPQHVTSLESMDRDVSAWVDEVAKLTQPDRIYWCDGSQSEFQSMRTRIDRRQGVAAAQSAELSRLRVVALGSFGRGAGGTPHLRLHPERDDAGPNNHWIAPAQAHAQMDALFAGCMRGRTLYVVPYCMGPIDSPFSRCGVEITDSAYVVLNMQLMTRMGRAALERITHDGTFVKGLHSTGDLNPKRRFIMHFPEELSIKSFGSGYGGNALLGKKCHALRIASWQARTEGWLAEHMLIVGIENPQGEIHYLACAFPSACGKTNLVDVDPARQLQGLEGLDGRRRHRLAAPRQGWPAVRHQSRVRILRRRAGHQCQDQSQCLRHDSLRHHIHQCRAHGGQSAVVGRIDRGQAGHGLAGTELSIRRTDLRRTRIRASPSRPSRIPAIRRWPTRPAGCRFPPSFSAAGAAPGAARVSGAQLGARRSGRARGLLRKRPPPPRTPSASCAAIPWP